MNEPCGESLLFFSFFFSHFIRYFVYRSLFFFCYNFRLIFQHFFHSTEVYLAGHAIVFLHCCLLPLLLLLLAACRLLLAASRSARRLEQNVQTLGARITVDRQLDDCGDSARKTGRIWGDSFAIKTQIMREKWKSTYVHLYRWKLPLGPSAPFHALKEG